MKPEIIKFNKNTESPTPKINKSKGIVEWGTKNIYPDYILNTYNSTGSALFTSIINKRTKLISNKGFELSSDALLNQFISDNKLNIEITKIVLDYELFNSFSFEIVWNKGGDKINKLVHIPISNIRIGMEYESEKDGINYPHYLYSTDWSQSRKIEYKPIIIPEFNIDNKKGNQVFVYFEYNPQNKGMYAVIPYTNILPWIEMDYKIGTYHLSDISNGYYPSIIVNVPDTPTEEEREQFAEGFKRNFQGEDKAGKVIITYTDGENSPTIVPFNNNSSDSRFQMLATQVENNIIQGMEIPLPLVTQVPGKLGGASERMELLNEYNESYIIPRQSKINNIFNEIFKGQFAGEFKLVNDIKTEIKTEDNDKG